MNDTSRSLFIEQLFDPLTHEFLALGAFPVQLAVPPIANVAALVDEINARPHIVGPCLPCLKSIVDGNGIDEAAVAGFCPQLFDVMLGFGLWRVNAENHQSLRRELVMPTLVPRVIMDAVNSSVGEEV